MGQPYVGVVPLHSGEIAEDLAAYLVHSEQIPSVVALGVLANRDGVAAAGGVIAQLLPGANERAIVALEERAREMPSITSMVAAGADARALLHAMAGHVELRSHRTIEVRYACLCSRDKVEAALLSLGIEELRTIADNDSESEVVCEFCKTPYVLSRAELGSLIERLETDVL